MAIYSTTKKRLTNNGVPESVAHRLADERTIEKVKDLGVHGIAEIYGLKITSLEDFLEKARRKNPPAIIQKARIIYYLIDPETRKLPKSNSPTSASFGIFNWWGEVGNNEQPLNLIQRFLDLHELSKVELRMKLPPRVVEENKSALVAMVLKEELK